MGLPSRFCQSLIHLYPGWGKIPEGLFISLLDAVGQNIGDLVDSGAARYRRLLSRIVSTSLVVWNISAG